jgi:hypothetical protein
MEQDIEQVVQTCSCDGKLLALIVRKGFAPERTTFVTPDNCNQQLGFVVYAAGTQIPRHSHLPLQRVITGTNEVLVVRRGSCTAEIFDESRRLIAEFLLGPGDVILLNGGAHGFRVHEDTVLMEIKQGPFTREPEKERF